MKDAFSWPALRDRASVAHLTDRPPGAEIPMDETYEALFLREDGRLVFRSGPVLFVEPQDGPR